MLFEECAQVILLRLSLRCRSIFFFICKLKPEDCGKYQSSLLGKEATQNGEQSYSYQFCENCDDEYFDYSVHTTEGANGSESLRHKEEFTRKTDAEEL